MNHLDMLPASAVLDMIDHARIAEDDCFYDLGAGLGQPTILVNLLCGARSVGVEYQPGYCEFARRRAELLGVRGVTFINADARQVNYADGTVFLLFSPFRGAILEHVLEKLREEPISKSLRICSFGPCSEVLANVTWYCTFGKIGLNVTVTISFSTDTERISGLDMLSIVAVMLTLPTPTLVSTSSLNNTLIVETVNSSVRTYAKAILSLLYLNINSACFKVLISFCRNT